MSHTSPTRLRAELLEDRLAPAQAGNLDPSFGSGGVATLPAALASNTFTAVDMAAGPDGKVVVAGNFLVSTDTGPMPGTTSHDFMLTRLTADGQVDTSFGGTGIVRVPFDLSGSAQVFNANDDTASGVAVQSDGKVVVVGTANTATNGQTVVIAARLTADGQLDPTFGTGGRAVVPLPSGRNGAGEGVAIAPNGSIVIAASDFFGAGVISSPPTGSFIGIRLTPAGQPDPTFGGNGVVSVPFPVGISNAALTDAVAVGPDGSVVLAGGVVTNTIPAIRGSDIATDFAAVKLTPAGQPDPTFGAGGLARVTFPASGGTAGKATQVAVLADGRVVLTGPLSFGPTNEVAARLTPTGQLDTTFGGSGQVGSPAAGGFPGLTGTVILPDGRVLFVAVLTSPNNGGTEETRVAGVTASGEVDPAFGSGGTSLPDLELTPYGGGAVVLPDERVVMLGSTLTSGPNSPLIAARITTQPTSLPVPTGSVLAGGPADGTARLLVPSGGQYAVGQQFSFFSGVPIGVRTATADVNGDGVPDLIGGAGPGGLPTLTVIDGKTGAVLSTPLAFEQSFTGGVFVTAGDLNGDGRAEIIVTPDRGGGPNVVILSLNPDNTISQPKAFFALGNPTFRGGARAAVGDVNGDGTPDLAVGAGFLGGPVVEIHDGKSVAAGDYNTLIGSGFFAFPGSDATTLRNGVFLAVGDVNGDGFADLVAGGGPGGGPRVLILDGKMLSANDVSGAYAAPVANFFFGDGSTRGGVRVATTNADGDNRADLVVGSGEGLPSAVRMYSGKDVGPGGEPATFQDLDPFGATVPGGVFVG